MQSTAPWGAAVTIELTHTCAWTSQQQEGTRSSCAARSKSVLGCISSGGCQRRCLYPVGQQGGGVLDSRWTHVLVQDLRDSGCAPKIIRWGIELVATVRRCYTAGCSIVGCVVSLAWELCSTLDEGSGCALMHPRSMCPQGATAADTARLLHVVC